METRVKTIWWWTCPTRYVLIAVFQVKRQAAQICVASNQTDTKERKQSDAGTKRQHPGERAVDTTRSAAAPLLTHDAS